MAETQAESQADAMITFKFLREIQKAERDSADLQSLPKDFFSLVEDYLRRKAAIVKRDPLNNEAQRRELEAIKSVVRYVFDRREQKITAGAIKAARTEFRLKGMLKEEEELFDRLVVVLRNSRTKFDGMMRGLENGFEKTTPPAPQLEEKKAPEPPRNTLKVKFTTDAPSFVAEDGQTYGPYSSGQEVELPKMAAAVLIKADKAEQA